MMQRKEISLTSKESKKEESRAHSTKEYTFLSSTLQITSNMATPGFSASSRSTASSDSFQADSTGTVLFICCTSRGMRGIRAENFIKLASSANTTAKIINIFPVLSPEFFPVRKKKKTEKKLKEKKRRKIWISRDFALPAAAAAAEEDAAASDSELRAGFRVDFSRAGVCDAGFGAAFRFPLRWRTGGSPSVSLSSAPDRDRPPDEEGQPRALSWRTAEKKRRWNCDLDQTINQSVYLSIDQQINQSINQSIESHKNSGHQSKHQT